MNRLRTNSHGEYMSIPGNSGYNWTVENATKIWLNCGPWAQFLVEASCGCPKYANDVYMNIHNPNPNPNPKSLTPP